MPKRAVKRPRGKDKGVNPPNPGRKKSTALIVEPGVSQMLKESVSKLRGADVPIGSGPADDDIEGATMADVAKLVDGVKYLVPPWIPYGMITGLVAEPGVGKSAFLLWLARSVVTGSNWFCGLPGPEPGYALWVSTENDMSITLDRVKKWHVPMDRLVLPFKEDPLRAVNLTDSEHLERIEKLINKYHPRLVGVDSLRSGHDNNENDSAVGRVLQNLAAIAERTKTAFAVVHHSKKLAEGESITPNACRGSNAILAQMRAQLGFDKPDRKGAWVRLQMLKENLGAAPTPLGFCITDAGLEFGPPPERPHRHTEKDAAEEWLLQHMEPGKSYLASDLLEQAEQLGHSKRTVRRAAVERLNVKPEPLRQGNRIIAWEWKLIDVHGNRQTVCPPVSEGT